MKSAVTYSYLLLNTHTNESFTITDQVLIPGPDFCKVNGDLPESLPWEWGFDGQLHVPWSYQILK